MCTRFSCELVLYLIRNRIFVHWLQIIYYFRFFSRLLSLLQSTIMKIPTHHFSTSNLEAKENSLIHRNYSFHLIFFSFDTRKNYLDDKKNVFVVGMENKNYKLIGNRTCVSSFNLLVTRVVFFSSRTVFFSLHTTHFTSE